MGKKVTLGGDRLGSGNKNKQELHNYYRSTHNLSQKWTSSMGCGILYPFLILPAMRGDTFDIDLYADARTIPTQGALFGSFKMQVDLFQCPIRLYQAILHNNPTAIGLKMSQVKFPKIDIETWADTWTKDNANAGKFSNSCLMKYLGVSGIGTLGSHAGDGSTLHRTFNAIPLLAYYDIFKNYYSNKQEQNAYVLGGGLTIITKNIRPKYMLIEITGYTSAIVEVPNYYENTAVFDDDHQSGYITLAFDMNTTLEEAKQCNISMINTTLETQFNFNCKDLEEFVSGFVYRWEKNRYADEMLLRLNIDSITLNFLMTEGLEEYPTGIAFYTSTVYTQGQALRINEFDLKNIDDMRMALLSHHTLGTPFFLGNTSPRADWDASEGTDGTGLPYSINFKTFTDEKSNLITCNKFPLNGLMLKTYQSDLYNNWILTDWIEGENGIAAITAISTADGSFTMDALNLAEKLYNMLNRIAVSGNTYEDWQDAVYTESPRRHIESPVFLGGMSSEIMFEEIVQTAPTSLDGKPQALGTLGGRGKHIKRKGGHVNVKVDEASFIIGIVSLTPRIVYTQGNEWYMTDLLSMDDFHKPALDGIGYEDLLGERMAWWNTIYSATAQTYSRSKVGKVPAWINYMTAVDKAFGDFAETEGYGYMVLNRNYEMGENKGDIKDATTYVDPSKYNYAFAYTDLDAQNFWVQIYSDIKARRLMSAKQIPNL